MSQILDKGDLEGHSRETYSSGYSNSIAASGDGNLETLPDTYHHDFVSFISLAQQLQIDFMAISWQPALYKLGAGASSLVMQSNMITKDLAFAFKRIVPRKRHGEPSLDNEKTRFRALLSEILIHKSSAVRDHPNINQLEGISWEIQNDIVWPVLVFPKANSGNLENFIHSAEGQNASFEIKLRLCIDVALALFTLHRNKIIHGDIKPDNILVSRTQNSFTAKITDFESSGLYSTDDDLLELRRTIPWDAPEWHDRYHSVEDAKRSDVYSFGLVCFWTMCRHSFEIDLVNILPELKAEDKIPDLVDMILTMWSDLSPRQNSYLSQFFKQTVCLERGDREVNFEKLIKLLSFNDEFRMSEPGHDAGDWPHQHRVLSIGLEFQDLIMCDFRVRKFLEKSLKSKVQGQTCNDCARQAAFQLVFGWKLGFFIPESDEIVEEYLLKAGRSRTELEAQVREVQLAPDPPIRISRTVRLHETVYETDLVLGYQFDGVLEQAEEYYRQELKARVALLGHDHILTRETKLSLASILIRTYRWQECREMLEQVLQSETKLGEEARTWHVVQSLAALSAEEGRWTEAEALQKSVLVEIEKSMGDENVLTLQALATLAAVYHGQGKWKQAAEIHRRLTSTFDKQLGPDHLYTVMSMASLASALTKQGLAKEALEIAEETLSRKRRLIGGEDRRTLSSEQQVAHIHLHMGDPEECIKLLGSVVEKQTRTLGSTHHDTLTSMEILVDSHIVQGRWKTALELEQAVVETRKSVLGARNPTTLRSMVTLGTLNGNLGNHEVAIDLISRAVEATKDLLGEFHPDTLTGKGVLSSGLRAKGSLKEAEQLGMEVKKALAEIVGKEHPQTLESMVSLAATYMAQDRLPDASALLKSAIEISTRTNGADHPATLEYLGVYAGTIQDPKEAEELRRRLLDHESARGGYSNPLVVVNKNNLAISLMHQMQWRQAEDIFIEILPVAKEVLGPAHKTTLAILANLASARCNQEHWDEAKKSYEEILAIVSETAGAESASALTYKSNIASVLMMSGQLEEAVASNKTVLSAMEKLHGEDHPETMRVINNLAACYSRMDRWLNVQLQLERLVRLAETKFGDDDSRTKGYRSDLEAIRPCIEAPDAGTDDLWDLFNEVWSQDRNR